MENRVELCCHTQMSKLQGINEAKEYIEEAIKRGYKAIAITDTDSAQSFYKAEEYLKLYISNENFKIIYGAEMHFKVSKNDSKEYTIYIYVKEQKGLKKLYELVTKAYKNMVNGQPMLYKSDLIDCREGLLYASIGNQSEIYKDIDKANINEILDFYDFVGIEPSEQSKNINIKIVQICKNRDKLLIGTSECNFIKKEEYKCNEFLNLYKNESNIEDGNNKYLKTTEELLEDFNYIENAREIVIYNPQKIADKIEKINIIDKKIYYPKIESAKEIITQKCYDKVKEIYGEKLPKEIEERLSLELNSILKNNFESIYLIYSELAEYSNKLGYEVGSRGSIGDSFVAYLLGITEINPIEYNLPFILFAKKDYCCEADIDMNFSAEIHSKIFEYLQDKFGKEKIVWAGTIGKISYNDVEEHWNDYINTFEKESTIDNELIISKIFEVKKCTGEHPGGIFIIPEDMEILDFSPVENGQENEIKTHIDYHDVWDNTGLYKFDILAHDDPTMLYELEKETGINSKDIKLDDKETLELFTHVGDKNYKMSTKGIPEFETKYVKKMLKVLKPSCFNDLVCISGFSHGTGVWVDNADDLIENEGKKVSEVISNREDMYNYFVNNGIDENMVFDIVEFIRKGKASIKNYIDNWNEYKKVLQEHNIPDWYIQSAEKIKYLFPKAHSIGYVMNEFKMAWYKVHYPEAFYKVYFKVKSELDLNEYRNIDKVEKELNELYELEKNKSDIEYELIKKIHDLEMVMEMFNVVVMKE